MRASSLCPRGSIRVGLPGQILAVALALATVLLARRVEGCGPYPSWSSGGYARFALVTGSDSGTISTAIG